MLQVPDLVTGSSSLSYDVKSFLPLGTASRPRKHNDRTLSCLGGRLCVAMLAVLSVAHCHPSDARANTMLQ